MKNADSLDTLDVALLPLQDGRQLMVPLQALVEVQQLGKDKMLADNPPELYWRGYELPIESLDALCGLPVPAPESLATVGIFRADKASARPFRALSFCGNSAHSRVDAAGLEGGEVPAEGCFLGATRIGEQVYLIPDLPGLLFNCG